MSAPDKGRQLSERIKEIVSAHIPRLKDPRIGFVTVTDVRMSRDNERATIYYTVLPDTPDQRDSSAAGLASATGLMRRDVGKVLSVRHTPELVFSFDDVADSGRRIEQILAGLDVQGAAAEEDPEAQDPAVQDPGDDD